MIIKPVQYLRGVAAMLVVWHHALFQVPLAGELVRLPHFGGYGVDLFFVISGFIMLVTTWDRPLGPAEFVRHRIRRIVPLYWLATLTMLAIAICRPALFKSLQWDAASLAKSLFFVPYYSLSFPDKIEPLLVPGWSLNYEMFFYALFALALLLKREWRLPAMAATIGGLVMAGRAMHPTNALGVVYTNWVMLEFVAGMILGRLWFWIRNGASQNVRRFKAGILDLQFRLNWGAGHRPMLALGDASYSIYLTHVFALGVLRIVWTRFVHSAGLPASLAWMAVALIGCAAVGVASYRAVEKPIMFQLRSAPSTAAGVIK